MLPRWVSGPNAFYFFLPIFCTYGAGKPLCCIKRLNGVIYTVSLLQQFLDKLARLKRGVTKYGTAPHKPVLLLAFTDLLDKGILTQNQVYVDADLVGAFLENWGLLVDTPHSADFTQPFYYL